MDDGPGRGERKNAVMLDVVSVTSVLYRQASESRSIHWQFALGRDVLEAAGVILGLGKSPLKGRQWWW